MTATECTLDDGKSYRVAVAAVPHFEALEAALWKRKGEVAASMIAAAIEGELSEEQMAEIRQAAQELLAAPPSLVEVVRFSGVVSGSRLLVIEALLDENKDMSRQTAGELCRTPQTIMAAAEAIQLPAGSPDKEEPQADEETDTDRPTTAPA